ncbi:MAG: transposase [Rubrivivax sp.]
MARLPRLVLPGQAHVLIQRGLPGQPVFVDADDRADFLRVLIEAAEVEQVGLHAFALLVSEVQLLATPVQAQGLARLVQAVGRRYVSAYNRRHRRAGTLWSGRFRCAVVEPGPFRLAALQWVDGAGGPGPSALTSAPHRLGSAPHPGLVDPPEYWALGNTPFEREAVYRRLLDQGLSPSLSASVRRAAMGGWALGSDGFVTQAGLTAQRPMRPRPRGRPRGRI